MAMIREEKDYRFKPFTLCAWSCTKIQNQPFQDTTWHGFIKAKPDVVVGLGDIFYSRNAYYTKKEYDKAFKRQWGRYGTEGSRMPSSLNRLIKQMGENFLVIWDDHDFGFNNSMGGKKAPWWKPSIRDMFKNKHHSKKRFLEYFPWLPSSRNGSYGLEYSKLYPKHNVLLVFLDLRWYKTKKQLLGPSQWAWFKELVMSNRDKQIVVISSSTLNGKDGWRSYKDERDKLLKLLEAYQKRPIIISGDVHKNKVTKWSGITLDKLGKNDIAKKNIVTELTTSGVRDNMQNRGHFSIDKQGVFRYSLKSNKASYVFAGSIR